MEVKITKIVARNANWISEPANIPINNGKKGSPKAVVVCQSQVPQKVLLVQKKVISIINSHFMMISERWGVLLLVSQDGKKTYSAILLTGTRMENWKTGKVYGHTTQTLFTR